MGYLFATSQDRKSRDAQLVTKQMAVSVSYNHIFIYPENKLTGCAEKHADVSYCNGLMLLLRRNSSTYIPRCLTHT